MTKREAAAALGVGVRTLERYTAQGKLPARYEKGPHGPVLIYEAADVTALKATLSAQRKRRPPEEPPALEAETLAFRIDPYHRDRLAEAGARQALSAGAYARRLVLEALDDPTRARLLEEMTQVKAEVGQLRADLATVLEMVLLNLTQASQEEIRAWVSQHLRGSGPGG